ncbi:hypothetical protein Ssi03_68980 [Sphaerisporangium siamense]|uniref:Uncharacterized protein n=1 Tax=Sphaerisporangium siamense TaxID=795645 RepID=A0A7W7D5M9_9ACTN|nr:hypothetical protein [Sphaerisporangium siamense]MBB4700561.1 hypothetical protein [Sphaerisporangium siamense]GII88908.1 hypothetical protein Ssi03_68980 [Sphaerisporangium siamense]
MGDARMRDFPGAVVRLESEADVLQDPEDQTAHARYAVEGLLAFCDEFCEPVSMDLSLAYHERDFDYPMSDPVPPRPFHLLRAASVPPGVEVRPAWAGAKAAVVDELSVDTVTDFVARALDQDVPGGGSLGWYESAFRATRVRLPEPLGTRGFVELQAESDAVRYPVERRGDGLWVSGPGPAGVLNAPIELRMTKESGLLVFEASVYWSLWAEDGPGRSFVKDGVERMRGLGWTAADEG